MWPQLWDKPETLEQWRKYFKDAPEGADVGTAAIELLNKLSSREANRIVSQDFRKPKSRILELMLYRCEVCASVKAFENVGSPGAKAYCSGCNDMTVHEFVAIDFAKKIFFTER